MIVVTDSTVLIGLFNLAKNMGLIHEVRPLINELVTKKFRISDKVIKEAFFHIHI